MNTPIYQGLLQSDLDFAGFNPVNLTGWPPTVGGGAGLDANTVTATSIGMVGDGVTDNTTALQTWLNSVGAAKVNSTLLVPDGVYIFSGSLQDTGRRNAQILFPTVAVTDPCFSITIKGYHPNVFSPWPDRTMPIPKGAVFKSTLATGGGTEPAFFGGKGPSGGPGPDNNFMGVVLENMIFQTVANPLISCLNLGQFTAVEFRGDVLVVAGNGVGETDNTQPTTTTSYGVILPKDSFGMLMQVENLNVFNFYTGVRFGELTHVINMTCCLCYYALEFGHGYHIGLIERIVDWHCLNGINVTNDHVFQVLQYDVERAQAAHWYTRNNDINDPSNLAIADITWLTVEAYVGRSNNFTINGGANIRARQVGTVTGTDLRVVQIVGGGKLQARNPGTNTWADVDQWTNP